MNANVMKTNTGKLLVAVLAMFMIVAGAAVLMSGEEANAAEPTYSDDGTTATVSDFESFQTALSNGTVTKIILSEDITATSQFTINKNVDLGTHTLTTIGGSGDPYYITGTVEISNGTINTPSNKGGTATGTAIITFENVKFTGNGMLVRSGAASSLTFNGCTFGSEGVDSGIAVYINSGACAVTFDDKCVFNGTYSEGAVSAENATPNITSQSVIPSLNLWLMTSENLAGIADLNVTETRISISPAYTSEIASAMTFPGETVVLKGDAKIAAAGSITVGAEQKFIVSSGVKLTNNGTITNDGSLILGDKVKFANNGTFEGNTVSAASTAEISGNEVPTLVAGGDDNLGLRGTLESDYKVTNLNYLSDNLVIKEGVTLTIASKGSFDLNGHTLTVNGTLVIERNGEVTAVAGGSVLLGAKGTIENSGVIGADSNVTVGVSGGNGTVTLKNVTGMTFGITKEVSGITVSNTLTVGGSVTAKGDNPAVIIDGAYITGDFSVNNLTMTIGSYGVTVLKNATFAIQSKAVVEGTGDINLAQNGATVVVNGSADIDVVAKTGEYAADVTSPTLTDTTVTVDNVKGLTITTGQYTYVNDNDKTRIVKTMVVSGTLTEFKNTSENADGSIVITATADDMVGVTVSDTLNVDETVSFSATADVYVTGTIVSDVDLTQANAAYINGTAYQVQTTDSTGAINDTYYITSFENAFGQIANAFENRITVYGDLEVSNEITITADNTVEIANGTLTIAESGRVNLDADANLSGAVSVDGILYCAAYSSYDDPVEYAAMSEDDDGNVTYAGLRAAIDNAGEGDTVTIVKGTTLEESLTVPAGITLQVNEEVTLTFKKDLTIQEGAKIVNQGIIKMTGEKSKLTVYGEIDSTEGTINAGDNVNVYSTGTITLNGITKINNGEDGEGTVTYATVNAAYYTNDDNNMVITSAAKAAAAVAQKDVGKTMNLSGTFSESGDFTADGIEIVVVDKAKVSLGTVTLDDAKIKFASTGANAGVLTATITAQTGADGSTTASTIAVSEINNVVIESADKIGSDNVTSWYLYLGGVGSVEPVGKYTVSAGTVTLNDTSMKFTGDNTLTVSAGATFIVPAGMELVAGNNNTNPSVTVEGTMVVNGKVDVTTSGIMYVTGTLDVEKATNGSGVATVEVSGTLIVAGTLDVSEVQDLEGTVTVKNVLVIGDKPTTLGATGTVNGPVDIDSTGEAKGYVKVYAGSTIDAGKIAFDGNESKAVNTVFHINGTEYMTVYALNGKVTITTVIDAEDFEIVGYDMSKAKKDIDNGGVYYWYTNADYSGAAITDTNMVGAEGSENVYYQAALVKKPFTVSVGPGISLYVDGVRITTATIDLGIGTYTVEAIVDPGYTGTTTITFNGQTVTGGTITVTADMVSDAYQGQRTIAASGAISQDSTVVIDGGSSGDSGMGLTDYLLIILVILIVVMAIIVAMRLMRS